MEAMRSLLTSGARRVREYVWEDTVGVYRPVCVWTMCVAQTAVFAYSLYANDCPAYADELNAAAAALNITQVTLPVSCPSLSCERASPLLQQAFIVHLAAGSAPFRSLRCTIGRWQVK